MTPKPRIEHILARFAKLHHKEIDLGLSRMRILLERLGNPQKNLPPIVHVAGSNGKGSTIAFLAAMAKAEGLAAHIHTSPHLVQINERFVLSGKQSNDETLLGLFEIIERANNGAPATQYELLTAAMFVGFAKYPADIALIEVGLGGELDATNVIENPALCLITPIALEHQDWLGSSMADIAAAKAGIIKDGCPVLCTAQNDAARDVLVRTAARKSAPISFANEDFSCAIENGRLVWQNDDQLLDLPLPNLNGAHQIENAALAIAAAVQLGWRQETIAHGLQSARHLARLQPIPHYPPVASDVEIWLDGAHNPHAARSLANFIKVRAQRRPLPLHLILGQQSTKDMAGFLTYFASFAPHIHCVPVPGAPHPVAPEILAAHAKGLGMHAAAYDTLDDALAHIPNAVRLVLTGSLYLAGNVLAQIKTPTK